MNFWWCILFPILAGLLCALLGYLLGRLLSGGSNNEEITELKNKISKLEADLEACKAKGSSLEADLNTCNRNKLRLEADLTAEKARSSSMSSSFTAPVAASLLAFDGSAAKAVFGKKVKQDDLKIVEGIGPKIEGLFNNFDIKTWKSLSEASVEKCQEVLNSGGDRYKIHKPGTWPKQAQLAYEGKWAELLKWQDELDGGKA